MRLQAGPSLKGVGTIIGEGRCEPQGVKKIGARIREIDAARQSVLSRLFNGHDVSDPTWMARCCFGRAPHSGVLAVFVFLFPIDEAFRESGLAEEFAYLGNGPKTPMVFKCPL
jgi:hypothetical protein